MQNKASISLAVVLVLWILGGCDSDPNSPSGVASDGWSIPQEEVFDGGPGKDGIPALDNPVLIVAEEASYLSDGDLVLGYASGSEAVAYPHPILDWHEIINTRVNGLSMAVTYCPLTGTGIGWVRTIGGSETTFGVSGLLFNSNLIAYDRQTDSNWSQMALECVNGRLIGQKAVTFPLLETTWATWKALYPQTSVVSTQTGHSRNYNRYPYGDYRTNNNNIIFPFSPSDNRLPAKERVHIAIVQGSSRAYPFDPFEAGVTLLEDEIGGVPTILVGSKPANFIMSFERRIPGGPLLTFSLDESLPGLRSDLLLDNEGNRWNLFGEAVSGPRAGQRLKPNTSFVGYWFAIGAFYPGIEIYSP